MNSANSQHYTNGNYATSKFKNQEAKTNKRIEKWIVMLRNMPLWKTGIRRYKLVDRCWKGIPNELRRVAWMEILSVDQRELTNSTIFKEFCKRSYSDYDNQIGLDVARALPCSTNFSKTHYSNLKQLFITLRCCSLYLDKDGGYCQSMSPIIAYLMNRFNSEETFLVFASLSQNHFRLYFAPGLVEFVSDCEYLKLLIQEQLPEFGNLMKKLDIEPIMFCGEWFMCAFVRILEKELIDRLWDVFVLEGRQVLFQMAMSIISSVFPKNMLMAEKLDVSSVCHMLNHLPDHLRTSEKLLLDARLFLFDHNHFNNFRRSFNNEK